MKQRLIPLILWILASSCLAGAPPAEEKRWWEKRHEIRPELYFPHTAHEEAMKKSGITCLSCHPFTTLDESDPEKAAALARVANEPLEAICHSCHIDDRSGPSGCGICHPDPAKIWPRSHDFDYVRLHALDGAFDEAICSRCHLDLKDCIDCHFRREGGQRVHHLGYRLAHGLEARMDPAGCGRCHNVTYCSNCHRNIRP